MVQIVLLRHGDAWISAGATHVEANEMCLSRPACKCLVIDDLRVSAMLPCVTMQSSSSQCVDATCSLAMSWNSLHVSQLLGKPANM